MRSLFSLLSLVLIFACSGKAPSKAGFQIDISQLPITSIQGGLVIFGHSTDGDSFSRVVSTSTGSGLIEEELPKGQWTFGAVAWDGAKGFTGDISCAFPAPVSLVGDEATVKLSLSNANCVDASVVEPNTFSAATPKVFAPLTPNVCDGEVSAQGTTLCAYSPTIRPIVKGFAGSYKMYLPARRKFGKESETLPNEYLESSCYNFENNSEPIAAPTYDATELNIPVFKDSVKFPLQILAFLGSACEESKGVLTRNLTTPSEVKIVNFTPGTSNYLNLSAPITAACTISENLPTPNLNTPAAGNGTILSPWLICSEEQLKAIQENFTTNWWPTDARAGVFVMGRDMNLLKFLSTSTSSCLRESDTFVPMGLYFSVGYPTCTLSTHTANGTFKFDGNGRTISYFRYMNSSTVDVGFFSTLLGDVYDVIFDRSEVEGGDRTGIVAGTKTGGLVKMITVKNSRVDGAINTGGLIGYNNGASNLYKLFGEELHVEGKDQTGGLIGHINTSNLTEAYFNGTVYSDSGTQHTGGIVGRIFGNIESSVAMGVVKSGGTKIGGIAGLAGNIKFVRSEVQLQDYISGTSGLREIGGIVGNQSAGAQVTNSLFMGNITSECNDPSCDLGRIVGTGTVAPADTFSTWSGAADGYNGSSTYTLGTIFGTGINLVICNGAPGCTWTQATGDKPRISSVESGLRTPICSMPANLVALTAQNTANRGSAANPFIICKPSQFSEMQNYPAEYFVLAEHINLSSTAALAPGDFDGFLDGKGHYIFGLTDLGASGDSALFDRIESDSVVKNLSIIGTKITHSGCGSFPCLVASLALENRGTLSNVHSEDFFISTADENVQTGGLVAENDENIYGSNIFGTVRSQKAVGGLAYHNSGTISDSRSEIIIDGLDAASNTGSFGGIVGENSGTLFRNRFKGKMERLFSAAKVGGIAAIINGGSVQDNNEFSGDASIETGTSATFVGGIAGFSNNSSAVLRRNLSKGTIFGGTNITNAKSLVGNSSFTADPAGLNFRKTVAQVLIESGTGSGATFSGAPNFTCTLDISYSVGNSNLDGVSGMVYDNNRFYHGNLDDDGVKYTFTTNTRDSSTCTGLNASLGVYKAMSEARQTLSIAALKGVGYGWDISVMTVNTDRDRVFNTYKEYLQGLSLSNKPVWIFDLREDGLELFGSN